MNPEKTSESANFSSGKENINQQYEEFLQAQAEAHAEFAKKLEPTPESDAFKAEIANPNFIEDPETGIKYATYALNRDKTGKPLVVNLAWSCGAESGVGRADLNEIAAHIDRPIYTIDMEATGKTDIPDRTLRKDVDFESLSASHLRIIDSLGIDDFDITGYSLGGVMAAGIAAQAGDRVGQIITMASPGFEDISILKLGYGFVIKEGLINSKVYRQDAAELRPTILAQDAIAQETSKGLVNRQNSPMLLKLSALMSEKATADAIARLSPSTKWTDVVGSEDAVTDWTGHLAAVQERNSLYPHSSVEHTLGTETHSMGLHRPAMAEIMATILAKRP